MARVDSATVALDIVPPPPVALDLRGASTLAQQLSQVAKALAIPPVGARNTVRLIVEANKRQADRGRDAVETAADIIRLYSALIGDVPFDAITVAMLEDELPGGHAPGYFTMINTPPPITPFNWRNDPAAFQGFPEFFMAHEMAHQWFGQAVGWKNYHEQWLSEGFAQYFAALYARERRGEGTFRDILRQFRRWAIEDSDQGPVYLGYRLGHIKNETRVFRALVYNKGAAVLHMLRGLVGDEHFFKGLRRFYAQNRFKKAGTDDLRKAMEAESGRNLERFFERWIYDSNIPRLRFSSAVEGQEAGRAVRADWRDLRPPRQRDRDLHRRQDRGPPGARHRRVGGTPAAADRRDPLDRAQPGRRRGRDHRETLGIRAQGSGSAHQERLSS